jgi:uncharacterized membrane protein
MDEGRGKRILLTNVDIAVCSALLKRKNPISQRDLALITGFFETTLSRRLNNIINLELINVQKVNKKNQNSYSINPKLKSKIKILVEIFT